MRILRSVILICVILNVISLAYGQEGGPGMRSEVPGRTVSVEFQPSQPRTGDDLKLKVAIGRGALRAEVRWSVNGQEVAVSDCNEIVNEAALGMPVKAGDQVEVSVTPFDAQSEAGRPIARKITIGNAPPHMKLLDQKIAAGEYSAKVEATDPEQEPISFILHQGPSGMSIDPNGRITWKFAQGTTGKFDVKVSAKDQQGGETVLFYSFAIRRSGS